VSPAQAPAPTTTVPDDLPAAAPTTAPPQTSAPPASVPTTSTSTTSTTSTTLGAAALSVSAGELAYGDADASRTLVVRNTGGRPLDIAFTRSSGALSVSPAGTNLTPGQEAAFTVGLDRSGMDEGPVGEQLRVLGSNDGSQLVDVPVAVTGSVRRPPTASLTLSKTTFQNACNSSNATSVVTVTANDDAGIDTIVLQWTGPPGNAGSKPVNGTTATLGPFPPGVTGTGQVFVVVTDVNGNSATSPSRTFTVQPCPG
jgi:hypothetical protein